MIFVSTTKLEPNLLTSQRCTHFYTRHPKSAYEIRGNAFSHPNTLTSELIFGPELCRSTRISIVVRQHYRLAIIFTSSAMTELVAVSVLLII